MIIKRKITVDSDRLGLVQLKIDKLNRKAVKLGIEPSHIVSQVDRVVKEKQQNDWTGQSVIVLRHVTDLEIVAHELKYGDYTYIATLDHTLGNLPVVHAVPDGVVPEMYYHAQGDCDHCKMMRQRSRTYIFKDHKGFKQVGSTCLLDFFGVDPTASLDWFGSYYGVIDEDYMGKPYQPTHSNITVLALALAISEKSGYVSSKKAIEKDIRAYCRRKRTFIIGHLRSRGGRTVSFKPKVDRQALRSGGCEDSAPMLLPWKGGVSLERLSSCIIEDTEVNASRIRTSVRLPRGMGDGKLYLMLGNSLSPLITEVIGNAILGDML